MQADNRTARTAEPEERPIVMQPKRKQNSLRYLRSEGNLALVAPSLQTVQKPKDKTLSATLPRPEQDRLVGYPASDDLSPARGIFGAIGLSVMLWWLVIFVIYWIYFSLKQARF